MWFNNAVNVNGIPTLDSTGISVGSEAVTITFRTPFSFNTPFRGLLLARLNESIPEGTSADLPIIFSMGGFTQNLTTYGGANVTVADIPGTGIYIVYYDRYRNTLQLLTGTV